MTSLGWRRAWPWTIPVLALVGVVLVASGLIAVHAAVIVGLAVEAVLWLAALTRAPAAVRRYRSDRIVGFDRWAAAEDGLAELISRPLARVLLLEPRLLECLLRWATGRHEGRRPGAFSYHRGLQPFLVSILALVVGEGVAVEAVVAILLRGTPWVWVVLGVHVYALVWFAGFFASLVTRPHRLGPRALFLRDGIFAELEVPYRAIEGVRVAHHSQLGRSGLKIDLDTASATLAMGDANLVVELDPTQPVPRRGRVSPLHLQSILITVDDSAAFVQELRARLGAGRPLP